MKIPFLRFDAMHAPLKAAFQEALAEVLDSHAFVLGPQVASFENAWAGYCGARHAIGVGNGLDALHLALRALRIGPGDEVIVPANTYIATVLAVSYTGATPVLAEPSARTANLDPESFAAAITSRTQAVIPVHLYGQPCEMGAILDTARRLSIHVIEDNAQAQGATYLGRRTGSFGTVNATSFYPGKNIGALGDGGALTTDDDELARQLRIWRNYGSEVKYYNRVQGYNSRLDELQAAFLAIKLRHLDTWNAERRRLAGRYQSALAGTGDLILPAVAEGAEPVWHLYVIRTGRRDDLQRYLADRGIGTLIHYPVPPHRQEAYRDQGWREGQFPLTEKMAATSLSLPMYPGLRDDEQDAVVDAIQSFFR